MAVQTLTLAGKRFVILPESEYRKLTGNRPPAKAARGPVARPSRGKRSDAGDLAEHKRRKAVGPARTYAELRGMLGLS